MLTIYKATTKDYATIANIHVESWNAAYAQLLPDAYIKHQNNLSAKIDLWQKVLAHPDVTVWMAFDSNSERSVGFIGCFNKDNDYEITTLYVLPDYQSLGVGSQLMTTVLKALSDSTAHQLYLWVLETNTKAIDFYKKFGFKPNGERHEESYKACNIVDIKMVKNA